MVSTKGGKYAMVAEETTKIKGNARKGTRSTSGPQGISGSSLVESRVHRLTGSGYGIPTGDDFQAN